MLGLGLGLGVDEAAAPPPRVAVGPVVAGGVAQQRPALAPLVVVQLRPHVSLPLLLLPHLLLVLLLLLLVLLLLLLVLLVLMLLLVCVLQLGVPAVPGRGLLLVQVLVSVQVVRGRQGPAVRLRVGPDTVYI